MKRLPGPVIAFLAIGLFWSVSVLFYASMSSCRFLPFQPPRPTCLEVARDCECWDWTTTAGWVKRGPCSPTTPPPVTPPPSPSHPPPTPPPQTPPPTPPPVSPPPTPPPSSPPPPTPPPASPPPSPPPTPCPSPLPLTPVLAEVGAGAGCEKGLGLVTFGDRRYCYALSEAPADVEVILKRGGRTIYCKSNDPVCVQVLEGDERCRPCAWLMQNDVDHGHATAEAGYVHSNDLGDYDRYCRRIGDGNVGGQQFNGKLIPMPPEDPDRWTTWRFLGVCAPRGHDAPCPDPDLKDCRRPGEECQPNEACVQEPSPNPPEWLCVPKDPPPLGADTPTGTCACPPLEKWRVGCKLDSDGWIRCDSTPRFGCEAGPQCACNADHHEACRCSGDTVTGTWAPCEDPRGPDWRYEGPGVMKGDGFGVEIKDAPSGVHVITACPKDGLVDSLGRPVRVGNDPCFTVRVEVP